MTELQGALGLAQLEKLESFIKQRISNAAFLTDHLKNVVQTPIVRFGYRHVYQQYTIRVPSNRNEWSSALRARGIETGIYYPMPIHQQPFYRRNSPLFRILSPGRRSPVKGGNPSASLPETEYAAQAVLSLPVNPALGKEDLATIEREVIALCK